MEQLIHLCFCTEHNRHACRIIISLAVHSKNILVIGNFISSRKHKSFDLSHIVFIFRGNITVKIKQIGILTLVRI